MKLSTLINKMKEAVDAEIYKIVQMLEEVDKYVDYDGEDEKEINGIKQFIKEYEIDDKVKLVRIEDEQGITFTIHELKGE